MSIAPVDFRRIWPLQAAASLMLLGGGLHFTLTPAHGQALGFAKGELGLIGSAYYAGFLAGSLLNAFAFHAFGHRVLFVTYALTITAAVAAQAMLTDVWAWILLRGVIGFLAAGIYAAIESWLNAIATNENRGRTLSAYTITNQSSLAAGQYAFAAVAALGGAGFYVASLILVAMVLPFAAMKGTPPPAPQKARIRLAALGRGSPVAFAGFVTNGLASAPFWTLGPVFARGAGLDDLGIAIFMSLPIFGSLVLQWPVARLSDGMDRRKVLLPVTFAASGAAALVALASLSQQDWLLYLGIVLFGSTAMLINMLATAHMNDRVALEDLTEAAGASYVAYGVAAMIGPLSASAMMTALGPAGLFWHAAFVLAAFGFYTLTRIVARAPAQSSG